MKHVAVRLAAVALTAVALAAAVGCGRRQPATEDAGASTAPASTAPESATPGPAAPASNPAAAPAAGAPGAPQNAATPGAAPAPGPATPPVTPPAATAPAAGTAEPAPRDVVLFFQANDDDSLVPEKRKMVMPDSVEEEAKRIVTELVAGPRKEGLLPTIPAGTKVLGVYLDRAGTAFVDLSEEFVSLHPGGSDGEVATVFSVVDSLTWNLKEVKRVRFLVGGEERDTLKNHLDLRRAYLKDMSIVNMDSSDGAGR
ncbi:MAG TPA: GerMN domain-containing protein [Patescibacteria group bacterium]|nr:GerMN domain-containing protein [Patescibacteria group bacterium]